MRTIVDIPDPDIRKLDKIASKKDLSRAEIVRRAVRQFIRDMESIPNFDDMHGIWKDRKDIGDAVEYQRKLRAEWNREWE
jgi:hypothetical protein